MELFEQLSSQAAVNRMKRGTSERERKHTRHRLRQSRIKDVALLLNSRENLLNEKIHIYFMIMIIVSFEHIRPLKPLSLFLRRLMQCGMFALLIEAQTIREKIQSRARRGKAHFDKSAERRDETRKRKQSRFLSIHSKSLFRLSEQWTIESEQRLDQLEKIKTFLAYLCRFLRQKLLWLLSIPLSLDLSLTLSLFACARQWEKKKKETSITFSLSPSLLIKQRRSRQRVRERNANDMENRSCAFQMNMQQCQTLGQRQVQPDRFLWFLFIPMMIVFLKLAQFARLRVCWDLFANLSQKVDERRRRKRNRRRRVMWKRAFISTAIGFDLPERTKPIVSSDSNDRETARSVIDKPRRGFDKFSERIICVQIDIIQYHHCSFVADDRRPMPSTSSPDNHPFDYCSSLVPSTIETNTTDATGNSWCVRISVGSTRVLRLNRRIPSIRDFASPSPNRPDRNSSLTGDKDSWARTTFVFDDWSLNWTDTRGNPSSWYLNKTRDQDEHRRYRRTIPASVLISQLLSFRTRETFGQPSCTTQRMKIFADKSSDRFSQKSGIDESRQKQSIVDSGLFSKAQFLSSVKTRSYRTASIAN